MLRNSGREGPDALEEDGWTLLCAAVIGPGEPSTTEQSMVGPPPTETGTGGLAGLREVLWADGTPLWLTLKLASCLCCSQRWVPGGMQVNTGGQMESKWRARGCV